MRRPSVFDGSNLGLFLVFWPVFGYYFNSHSNRPLEMSSNQLNTYSALILFVILIILLVGREVALGFLLLLLLLVFVFWIIRMTLEEIFNSD